MSFPSEKQIKIYDGGNYADLSAFLDRKTVRIIPFVTTQTITPSAAQFILIDSSFLAGTIALDSTSVQVNGGIVCAKLSTAVGTAATTNIVDGSGAITNLIDIRASGTNDPLYETGGKKIWGLLQAASTVTDGDAIGAALAENVQMSFIYYDSNDALTLVTVDESIEFQVNKLYSMRNVPTLTKEGGVIESDIITVNTQVKETHIKVTTLYPANSVITLSTGAGVPSGAGTVTGDVVTLPTSAALFKLDGRVRVIRNGLDNLKGDSGIDVTWDTTGSLHFGAQLEVDEIITILGPSEY